MQEPVRRPQGVPYFQWFYCVKGHGELILNNQRSIITKGQGFLIYPDQEHIYQAISNNWTLHIAAFNGPLCSDILTLLQMGESGAYHFRITLFLSSIFRNCFGFMKIVLMTRHFPIQKNAMIFFWIFPDVSRAHMNLHIPTKILLF